MTSLTPLSARSVDQQMGYGSPDNWEVRQQSARKGALLAFQAAAPSAKPLVNNKSGINGALAAATKAGVGQQSNKMSTVVTAFQIDTPMISQEASKNPTNERSLKRATSRSIETLRQSTESRSSRQQSPSHIAATLAAARSTPTPVTGKNTNLSSKGVQNTRGQSITVQDRKDESSIPPTNALVQLFESQYGSRVPGKNVKPSPVLPNESQRQRHIVSPIPIRPSVSLRLSSRTLNEATRTHNNTSEQLRSPKESVLKQETTNKSGPVSPMAGSLTLHPRRESITAKVPPILPAPRRSTRPTPIQISIKPELIEVKDPPIDTSSDSSYASARDSLSRTNTVQHSHPTKPLPTPTFAPSVFTTLRPLPSRRASAHPSTGPPPRLYPHLTADSLANAMVASSLASSRASSRATSPSKVRPYSLFAPSTLPSRTPSPSKHLRLTLRKESQSSDEDQPRRAKIHTFKKHPHKHAEGARKRWRDVITEKERKRYEGVWATNRGLLLQRSPSSTAQQGLNECVHALVVKDIWSRSQLAQSTLAEIWELVAERNQDPVSRSGQGTNNERILRREEFVVGMWLVDQCLKGRKLPVRVGESVWESVRGLRGVRIKGGNGGRGWG